MAYVDFASEESAALAINALQGKQFGSQTLNIKFYEKPQTFVPTQPLS